MDTGLAGYKARHNLAVVYREQGRLAEAETQWRAAVEEQPGFAPAWMGLGEAALAQERWEEVNQIAGRLEDGLGASLEAAVLRGRAHLARKEFTNAKQLMQETADRFPNALSPKVILSHACLQSEDGQAAERALRGVLALDPDNAEARHNLAVLFIRRPGSAADAGSG